MISVTVQDVVKRFGSTVALDGVSIEVKPGELFFLLGPSGCGKTTLLRSIAGFYIPDEGRILFGEEDITRMAPHRRNAGMMFQSYALWPHMTVAENVAFGLKQRKIAREEISSLVREALESVQMEEYGQRKPNQLSGGQQQRVALARALIIRPRCLLLDEPLSNLDAKLRLEMRAQIRGVCKDFNLTAIYVTHDQKEALSIADRMAVLHEGRVLQVGTPLQVYRRPANRFVADFIGETNFIDAKVVRSAGGNILVECALGEITGVPFASDFEPVDNSKVLLSIRPEAIRLDPIPADENCIAGNIGDAVYYGETAQYTFITGTLGLKVFELNPRFLARTGTADIYAFVDAEDVVVLPAESGGGEWVVE